MHIFVHRAVTCVDDNDTTIYKCHNMSVKSLQGRRTPGSRDECRTASHGHLPLDQVHGLEPLACLKAAKKLYIHRRHLLLLSPIADTHFTIPQMVED